MRLNELDLLLDGPAALVKAVQSYHPRYRLRVLNKIRRARPDLDVFVTDRGKRLYHIASQGLIDSVARARLGDPIGEVL
jgi:hypothetical protein